MPDRSGSLGRVRLLALAAHLVLSIAGAGPSIAEEGPREPVPAESLPEEKTSTVEKVMDGTHAFLERSILERVIRFDDFFGSVKTEDARQPDYLLRWQNSLRWDEGGRFKYRTSVRASARLPKISERLRLVVSGENEAEPVGARLPEDPGNPGFDRTLQNTRLVNTELRYGVIRRPEVDLFLGAGARFVLPMETFVRTRLLYTRRFGEVYLARFGETLFWKDVDGFGETTEISVERQLGRNTLLRWANSGTVSESSQGLEWGSELSFLREFSPRRAITLAGGIFGNTRPAAVVQTYRILSRYRQNFLRDWLFYELEPEISWPRKPEGGYTAALALTFRLEVVFRGSAAGKEKSPGSS
ncbi:MAG: hypothetical protein HZA60_10745 [Deltaproteobacteria bacterium]|nr:hypothetical protein [Deltaproteobacteria bacterium]